MKRFGAARQLKQLGRCRAGMTSTEYSVVLGLLVFAAIGAAVLVQTTVSGISGSDRALSASMPLVHVQPATTTTGSD